MAVSGEDPAIRSAPRARFGSDLKPRVAAAVVDGEPRAGDGVDRRLYLRRFLVARVDCRPLGVATAGRRRAARRAGRGRRSRACARCVVCASQFDPRRHRRARSRRGRGRLAGRTERGNLGGRGRDLRRRAGRQRRAAENQSELRLGRDFMAFRGRLGNGYRGLFRRTVDRRPSTLAERLAWQDLGRGDRRRARRRGSRPHARGVDEPSSRRCSGSGLRRRSSPSLAICSNPRSSDVSASKIRAASFPAMAD